MFIEIVTIALIYLLNVTFYRDFFIIQSQLFFFKDLLILSISLLSNTIQQAYIQTQLAYWILDMIIAKDKLHQEINMEKTMESLEEQWICPITKLHINEPVLTVDGHVYEKSAIQHWFKTSNKSPKTGLNLSQTILIPCHVLKSLKQKINQQIPPIFHRTQIIEQENKHFRSEIKQLREQIQYYEQKFDEQLQISKKQEKLKKMQEKQNGKRKERITELKKQVQQLQGKIQQQIKKQSLTRVQHLKTTNQLQLKINQLNEKIEKLIEAHQDDMTEHQKKYKKIIHDLQNQINAFILMTASTLAVFNQIRKCKSTSKATLPNTKISKNKIATEIEEQIKQSIDEIRFCWMKQYGKKWQIIGYIVKRLSLDPKNVHQIEYSVKTYLLWQQKFVKVKYIISYRLFYNLFIKTKCGKNSHPNLAFIQGIDDMYDHQGLNNSDWIKLQQFSEHLLNLQILEFQYNEIRDIKKEELQKFKKLSYLNLRNNPLTEESKEALKAYGLEHPEVVIVYDGNGEILEASQSDTNDYSSDQGSYGMSFSQESDANRQYPYRFMTGSRALNNRRIRLE